jgi:ribosomal protein L31
MAKKNIHPQYHNEVKVICISGHEYTVSAGVVGPIKVEACPQCHSTYTWVKRKVVEKGRMQKYLEKQKKMEAMKKAA